MFHGSWRDIYYLRSNQGKEVKVVLPVMVCVLLCLCGCNSTSPSSEQTDMLKAIKKTVDETSIKFEGSNNTITETKKSVDINIQETKKINEQIGEGARITTQKMDSFKQDFSKISNSSWMVWGIVALETVVIIVAILGLLGLIYIYVKSQLRIHKVIASDDNNLTLDTWEKHK